MKSAMSVLLKKTQIFWLQTAILQANCASVKMLQKRIGYVFNTLFRAVACHGPISAKLCKTNSSQHVT